MRIAICDDCRDDALAIKNYLYGQEVRLYYNAESLLSDMEQRGAYYDLYLLDIYIEDSINGIELAEKLRSIDEEAVICFVSSSDDFYREAYDLYAIQYLIKPVRAEDVRRLLDKVTKHFIRHKEKTLKYSWRRSAGVIPYGKILYISSREHILYIHCKDGRVQESVGKLDDLECKLDGEVFMRCHQSFLVNIYHVEELNGSELVVGREQIPVSRRYCAEVKKRYQEIVFEEVDW